MIVQFHTPNGIVEVDSENVTAEELAKLGISREDVKASIPRNILTEIDELKAIQNELKAKVAALEK